MSWNCSRRKASGFSERLLVDILETPRFSLHFDKQPGVVRRTGVSLRRVTTMLSTRSIINRLVECFSCGAGLLIDRNMNHQVDSSRRCEFREKGSDVSSSTFSIQKGGSRKLVLFVFGWLLACLLYGMVVLYYCAQVGINNFLVISNPVADSGSSTQPKTSQKTKKCLRAVQLPLLCHRRGARRG